MARLIDADALMERLEKHKQGTSSIYRAGIDTAEMFIDEAQTVGGWINVKDRLPELAVADGYDIDGTPYDFQISEYVLAYESGEPGEPGEVWIAMLEDDGKGPFWTTKGGSNLEVTHWMPLPEPPEEEENA